MEEQAKTMIFHENSANLALNFQKTTFSLKGVPLWKTMIFQENRLV